MLQIIQNKKEISFPNCNNAYLVETPDCTSAIHTIKALDIPHPKTLFLIIGNADKLDASIKPPLIQLFGRGIARAAINTGALIVDGGTQAGVMELMGQGVADQGRKSILLGVAPAGKVTYPGGPEQGSIENGAPLDPNHSHFVLVEGREWGIETETMFELVKILSRGIPVVTVLVGGGSISKKEMLLSVRLGCPIIVIEKTGFLANEITRLKKKDDSSIKDPVMAEIIADGDIHLFSLDGSTEELEYMITSQLYKHMEPTLKLAWERFALYDANAISQQDSFKKMQKMILYLGVFVTLLVLIQSRIQAPIQLSIWVMKDDGLLLDTALHYIIIVIPITISILIAAANRFKAGNKWVLLRASAEAIKREIFLCRSGVKIHTDQQTSQLSHEGKLANVLEYITRQLMQTDVNQAALHPYKGKIPPDMDSAAGKDDGLSFLTPERYITIRLRDQLTYYQDKTNKLERDLKRYQWSIYILGGTGTFLAAVGLEIWIALTISIVGALTIFLEYQQIENTLTNYNQTATDLTNIRMWWTALSEYEKTDQGNISKLVEHTETVLQGELTGWIVRMEDALAKLREQQSGNER